MPIMPLKVKRKTQREIRLGEYVNGFYHCLHIFEEGFREEADKARRSGKYSNMADVAEDPRVDAIWTKIEKASKEIRAKDNEFRDLRASRR